MLRPATLLTLPLLLLGACLAPGADPEGEPYTPPPEAEPASIGFFLTSLDGKLRAWTNLKLAARSDKERRTLRGLERELNQATTRRQDELVAQLDSPSPKNRGVAAIALGFTGDPAVVGPMLGALSDRDPLVVNNALVGLGVLASPDTPLAQILFLMSNDPDDWTRNNAAFALTAMVSAGARDPALQAAARGGLTDGTGGVRAQSASLLGMLHDAGSTQALGDLLFDEHVLVARAAAAALSTIGREVVTQRGSAARLLVDAAAKVDSDLQLAFLLELSRMSSERFGDDLERWTEWAYRLP